jgi:hypothetical protein
MGNVLLSFHPDPYPHRQQHEPGEQALRAIGPPGLGKEGAPQEIDGPGDHGGEDCPQKSPDTEQESSQKSHGKRISGGNAGSVKRPIRQISI